MDQRERYYDPSEVYRAALENWQTRLWTALPCVVQAFPAASGLSQMMLDAQPAIAGSALNAQGGTDVIQMPLLVDVPIQWMGGGGVTATYPIKKGDECLVIFASRCIDLWWQQGAAPGNSPGVLPPDTRMHNLSDGFALVGLRSLPREFAVDPNNACLITDDGQAYFKLNPTTHAMTMLAKGGINLNGVTIDQNGNITSPATVTAATEVKVGAHTLTQHTHGGVTTGSGTTAKPTG